MLRRVKLVPEVFQGRFPGKIFERKNGVKCAFDTNLSPMFRFDI
jgi:hypothetical protein